MLIFLLNPHPSEHRRIFRREFDSIDASTTNKSHEVNAARRLLRRLLTSTDHLGDLRMSVKNVRLGGLLTNYDIPLRAAADAILSITYGITPTDFSHPLIKTPEGINAIFADVAKGGYLGFSHPPPLMLKKTEIDYFSGRFSLPETYSQLVPWCPIPQGGSERKTAC